MNEIVGGLREGGDRLTPQRYAVVRALVGGRASERCAALPSGIGRVPDDCPVFFSETEANQQVRSVSVVGYYECWAAQALEDATYDPQGVMP